MPRKLNDYERLGRMCVEQAKRDWGTGWSLLSQDIQKGAIATKVLYIAISWSDDTRMPAQAVTEVAQAAFRTAFGEDWSSVFSPVRRRLLALDDRPEFRLAHWHRSRAFPS